MKCSCCRALDSLVSNQDGQSIFRDKAFESNPLHMFVLIRICKLSHKANEACMNTQASGLTTSITIHSPNSSSSSSLAASSAQNAANAIRSVGLMLLSPHGDEFSLGFKPVVCG